MDFLNKLYESDYFGIGLFAVVSFLVITFLVVLFFGKRDEKKRKLAESSVPTVETSNEVDDNAFKEVSPIAPVELPISADEPITLTPIQEDSVITPSVPFETIVNPIDIPVAPMVQEPIEQIIEPISIMPVATEIEAQPVSVMPNVEVPNSNIQEPVITPILSEPEPLIIEPVKIDVPVTPITPKVMDEVKITIPDNQPSAIIEPVIKEEETPIITPVMDVPQIVEEPIINDTYYKPLDEIDDSSIQVPSIDFDALAQSISDELDELEKNATPEQEQVRITPISEITKPVQPQYSSVYVNKRPVKPVVPEPVVDLPSKIDLPTKKDD